MSDERKMVIEYGGNSPEILLDLVAAEIAARLFAGRTEDNAMEVKTN